LAQAVAHELRSQFADGVRLVELASLADPDLVAAAVARALGIAVGDPHTALDPTVRLLTAGSRLALRRHQTLRAALEWGYGLLSEPEQLVLDRLSVLAGSFSLESAQQLASDDAIHCRDGHYIDNCYTTLRRSMRELSNEAELGKILGGGLADDIRVKAQAPAIANLLVAGAASFCSAARKTVIRKGWRGPMRP
jgi:hypothetical protein